MELLDKATKQGYDTLKTIQRLSKKPAYANEFNTKYDRGIK